MKHGHIALLIPVYNDPGGLQLSLNSLPAEVSLDVVVVDDGSEPPVVLRDVPPSHRFFLLRTERNRGIQYALNYGLQWILARNYSYVARLDCGDVALPGRFLWQLLFLEEHPEYALVGGQACFIDESGACVFEERLPTTHEEIRAELHLRNCFLHSAVMLRVSALRVVGLFSEDCEAAEDYDLFFRIAKRFKVANLDRRVVLCRLDRKGISFARRGRQLRSRLKIMLRHFDPRRVESWLGVMRTAALLPIPATWVWAVKRRWAGRRGGL